MNTHSNIAKEAANPLDFIAKKRSLNATELVTDALAHGRAQLAFQPIVAARDSSRIAFYEGLIRVRDEMGRLIPAGDFMGDIEEKALGREVDCASLSLGMQTLRENPGVRLSINMSARSMADGKWRHTLEDGLRETPEIGQRLVFEINETSAMLLHEVLVRFIAEWQPYGVTFALDDFGDGLLAFRHLKEFLFDWVKIDKVFVRNIHDNPDNQVMAEALIAVAKQFGMYVVAEGVEQAEEAAFLTKAGVDCMQGYFFAVPRLSL